MPLLDTRAGENSLMGRFIADVVLQILSFVAENERVNIRTRQAEGIALAKARGVKFGRPKKKVPQNFSAAALDYMQGKSSLNATLELLNFSRNQFYYRYRQFREKHIRQT